MKKTFQKMDIWLLIIMLVFSGFGLLMIFSASSITAVLRNNTTSTHYFIKQLVSIAVAFLVGFLIIIKIPTKIYKYGTNFVLFLIIGALIFVFSYGYIRNGSQSWYDFGYFDFQPAEFAKPILIIYFGVYYYKLSKLKQQNPFTYTLPLIIAAIMAFLIWRQPDFGGAIIIIGIAILLFWATPIPPKIKNKIKSYLFLAVIFLVSAVGLFGNSILNSHQLERFTFFKPCSRYREDTGYQVCNGYIAINNGGVLGVGLGNSTQKYMYLPEAHTDFIFPIIIEELGYIVGIIVLLGYGFLLCRILIIAKKATNLRNSIIAYGCFLLLTAHILINLLGVLGLIPLTGIPLPFLSYGGSYCIVTIGLLFVVQRISIENKINQDLEEIKKI